MHFTNKSFLLLNMMLQLILKIHFLGWCQLVSVLTVTLLSTLCWQLMCTPWGFRYLFFAFALFFPPS